MDIAGESVTSYYDAISVYLQAKYGQCKVSIAVLRAIHTPGGVHNPIFLLICGQLLADIKR
eukprot:scaffold68059_cov37-Prasinocladus_malaysianus.AAC.1